MATASTPAATANDDQISASRVDGLALCGCELGRRGYEKSAPGRVMRFQAVEWSGGSIDDKHCSPRGLLVPDIQLPQAATDCHAGCTRSTTIPTHAAGLATK